MEIVVEIEHKGGEGSGNFGHVGRPGEVGGSGEGGEGGKLKDSLGKVPSASEVKTIGDLSKIKDISLPKDTPKYEYFYHAVRYPSMINAIEKEGIKAGPADRLYGSKQEVRSLGAGFVIFRAPTGIGEHSMDVIEQGLAYHQWSFSKSIPPEDIVRTVREVLLKGTNHTIREDQLADYALKNQNTKKDISDLPEVYQRWFFLDKKYFRNIITKSSSRSRQQLWRSYIREQSKWERKMALWLREYFHDQGKLVIGRVKSLEGLIGKGGSGSGNFGHGSRPGLVGGSGEGGSGEGVKEKVIGMIANTENAKIIRKKYDGIIESLAKDFGLTKKEYIDKCEKFLKEEIEKVPIGIRVSEGTLFKILEDGRIKNQFESGKTGPGKTVGQKEYENSRREYEDEVYGFGTDTANEDRPIYGYYILGKDSTNSWLSDYGNTVLVLKSDVKDRSTFTDSDSLDINYSSQRLYPSPANNPSIYSTYGISNHSDVIDANKPANIMYWEAQIFGGVKLNNIEKVMFYEKPSSKIISKLGKMGMKYEIRGKK